MASVVTEVKRWDDTKAIHIVGSWAIDENYATGGITPAILKPGTTQALIWLSLQGLLTNTLYFWDPATGKVVFKQVKGSTPVGTIAAPTFTGSALAAHAHDLLVKGGQAAATTNDLAHYATDILGKEAATDATITGAASGTKGGVITVTAGTPAGTISAPVFTGTAPAVNGTIPELVNATAIAATLTFYAIFPKFR